MGGPDHASEDVRRALGDRPANKNPIRCGRTGLDAVTRLRVGELRFRKGQDTNVHRFIVAGGGPFLTVRCRDRSTHSIPQESSAGRNLITVFCHVNNPAKFFSGCSAGPAMAVGGDRLQRSASPARTSCRRFAMRFRKAHKKRHFTIAASECIAPARSTSNGARAARIAARRPFWQSFRADDRQADLASHKSICAKTAQTFSTVATIAQSGGAPEVADAGCVEHPARAASNEPETRFGTSGRGTSPRPVARHRVRREKTS